MNPKTLQYLMEDSDIGVTMNTYIHLGLDDAKNEMIRMKELEQARKEVDKTEVYEVEFEYRNSEVCILYAPAIAVIIVNMNLLQCCNFVKR